MIRVIVVLSWCFCSMVCISCKTEKLTPVSEDKAYPIDFPKKHSEKTILTASWLHIGLGESEEKHTYLKVDIDGSAEFQDRIVDEHGKVNFISQMKNLSLSDLDKLNNILLSLEKEELLTRYLASTLGMDSFTMLEINFTIQSNPKITSIINYDPRLINGVSKYPGKLIQLICFMERIRGRKAYSINEIAKKSCSS